MFAPTLLDIAHKLNVGVGILSVIFLVRAIGGVTGTVGSGILMDHFPKKQNALLGFMLFGGIVGKLLELQCVHSLRLYSCMLKFYYQDFSYLLEHIVTLFLAAISVVPVSVHIAMLGVVMFMMGVTLGGLDNGICMHDVMSFTTLY